MPEPQFINSALSAAQPLALGGGGGGGGEGVPQHLLAAEVRYVFIFARLFFLSHYTQRFNYLAPLKRTTSWGHNKCK